MIQTKLFRPLKARRNLIKQGKKSIVIQGKAVDYKSCQVKVISSKKHGQSHKNQS